MKKMTIMCSYDISYDSHEYSGNAHSKMIRQYGEMPTNQELRGHISLMIKVYVLGLKMWTAQWPQQSQRG